MEMRSENIGKALACSLAAAAIAVALAVCGCSGGVQPSGGAGTAEGSEAAAADPASSEVVVAEEEAPVKPEMVMLDVDQLDDAGFSLHVDDAVKGSAGTGTITVGEGQSIVTKVALEGEGFAECELHEAGSTGNDGIVDMWTVQGDGEYSVKVPDGTYDVLVLVHEGSTGDISLSAADAGTSAE